MTEWHVLALFLSRHCSNAQRLYMYATPQKTKTNIFYYRRLSTMPCCTFIFFVEALTITCGILKNTRMTNALRLRRHCIPRLAVQVQVQVQVRASLLLVSKRQPKPNRKRGADRRTTVCSGSDCQLLHATAGRTSAAKVLQVPLTRIH